LKTAYQGIVSDQPAFSFASSRDFWIIVRTKAAFKANIILKAFATMFMGVDIHRGGVVKRDT